MGFSRGYIKFCALINKNKMYIKKGKLKQIILDPEIKQQNREDEE